MHASSRPMVSSNTHHVMSRPGTSSEHPIFTRWNMVPACFRIWCGSEPFEYMHFVEFHVETHQEGSPCRKNNVGQNDTTIVGGSTRLLTSTIFGAKYFTTDLASLVRCLVLVSTNLPPRMCSYSSYRRTAVLRHLDPPNILIPHLTKNGPAITDHFTAFSGARVVSRTLVARARPGMRSTAGLLVAVCMSPWVHTLTAADYCM